MQTNDILREILSMQHELLSEIRQIKSRIAVLEQRRDQEAPASETAGDETLAQRLIRRNRKADGSTGAASRRTPHKP